MSDFGSMVTVHRVDGSATTPADEAKIKRFSRDIVIGPGDRISDYADFELRFGGSTSKKGTEGVMVGLTAYMVDDEVGNEGWTDDALIARDQPLAEQFGSELQALLGTEFEVDVYCGHW